MEDGRENNDARKIKKLKSRLGVPIAELSWLTRREPAPITLLKLKCLEPKEA